MDWEKAFKNRVKEEKPTEEYRSISAKSVDRFINDLRNNTNSLQIEYSTTKVKKESRDRLVAKLDYLLEKKKDLEKYKNDLVTINKVAVKEYREYRCRRIDFLNNTITSNIQKIFPYEGYKSRIVYETKYNNSNAYVTLLDKNGNVRIPKYSEGGLLKELIGFTSAISVLECLDSNTFLFDEAFGMASKNNKPKLGDMLNNCINNGVQMFLVSQTSDLYDGLNCRKIYLERDAVTNQTYVSKVEMEE